MTAGQRRNLALAVLAGACAAVLGMSADAQARRQARARDRGAIEAVAKRLPSSDLALSSGARWHRYPSQEEPGAAFADGPAFSDMDPAGGLMAPPIEAWSAELRPTPKRAEEPDDTGDHPDAEEHDDTGDHPDAEQRDDTGDHPDAEERPR
ncbi:hypothetical protein [Pendulispora albinea]|uniref:Uncharacterized protein n=1 Tax=Pendulispora albinea TaxID=2741071 RepID=A0ABZ2LXL2_9BACT